MKPIRIDTKPAHIADVQFNNELKPSFPSAKIEKATRIMTLVREKQRSENELK